MPLSRIEQELIISFNAQEKTALVYTSIPSQMRKLDALAESHPLHVEFESADTNDGQVIAKSYIVDKKLISIRKPRTLTETQKTELSERAKENFNK